MNISAVLPSFLASIVEFVEALTIVLAMGVAINWKSSLLGALAGFAALVALICVFGTTVVLFIPISVLRLVVGVILVMFGLQWLKKAVLRYSGIKAIHDEEKIFKKNVAKSQSMATKNNEFNFYGFITSFKGVLLEGLEVAIIVITFGSNASAGLLTTGVSEQTAKMHGIISASIGAAAALVIVVCLGFAIHKPLTKVPENTLKYIVGIMLVSFGTFWSGEGLGITWLRGDLFIFVLIAFYLCVTGLVIFWLSKIPAVDKHDNSISIFKTNAILRIVWEIYDFFVGDMVNLVGVCVNVVVVHIIILGETSEVLDFTSVLAGAVYLLGICITFIFCIRRARYLED